jgi:hypothetical protein
MALFSPDRFPLVVGRLARPGLIAQALAPPLGAYVLTHASADALWWILPGLGLSNLALTGALWTLRRSKRAAAMSTRGTTRRQVVSASVAIDPDVSHIQGGAALRPDPSRPSHPALTMATILTIGQ